ncbi:ABC transporter ATP-binding protein [Rhodobacter sp. 24-YEA-8]|uniref:ABC transporter ATP-binding protein n=1 Tax=Rhodobacter sp. 24-YEA-8 TaxID=1884310 RepID=UPI00089BFFF3|nr:ABC transporter ATP-binding protein [Rhodobacter sp. 24-YEA-8]SED27490.1 peptide/nickel transport system ATP-binding protein/peptide/nickel transport system ATP-binding protein/dipeptide transport system ATP-binding protein [Rhodobacter sp. 24-YEA-8]
MNALEIRDLTVTFGGSKDALTVVDAVSLTVAPGEILALVGESGSGKSMTSLAVMGLLPPAARVEGRITVGGAAVSGLGRRALEDLRGRQMGMVFQEPMTSLNPVLTIRRQMTEGPRRHLGLGRAEAEKLACAALAEVGIPDPVAVMGQYPHQLSGGMRQRVMIASVLALKPALLIADEPTTALDVTVQGQVLDLLVALKHRSGSGILLITHDIGVVAETADRVAVMQRGRIVETGPVDQVLFAPRHDYTRKLLAAHLDVNEALAMRAEERKTCP